MQHCMAQIGLWLGLLKNCEHNFAGKKKKGIKNDDCILNTLNLKLERTQLLKLMQLGKFVGIFPKTKSLLGSELDINRIAGIFAFSEKTLGKYSMLWKMDDDNPKSTKDLKFEPELVLEPLQLKHFSSPANLSFLKILITAEQEVVPCSWHTILSNTSL